MFFLKMFEKYQRHDIGAEVIPTSIKDKSPCGGKILDDMTPTPLDTKSYTFKLTPFSANIFFRSLYYRNDDNWFD